MTKEKAGEVSKLLKFWADGGTLWTLSPNDRCFKIKYDMSVSFIESEVLIMEDAHFEARKAFALGEELECRVIGTSRWLPEGAFDLWRDNCAYRAKPQEWYNCPENRGIPIMVRNNTSDTWKARTFNKYDENFNSRFKDDRNQWWFHARLMIRSDMPYPLEER